MTVSPSVIDNTKVDTSVAYSPIITHLDTPPDEIYLGHQLEVQDVWSSQVIIIPGGHPTSNYMGPQDGFPTDPWDAGPPPLEAPDPIPGDDPRPNMIDKSNVLQDMTGWQLIADWIMPDSSGFSPISQVNYGIPKSIGKPTGFDLVGGKPKWPEEETLAAPDSYQPEVTTDHEDPPVCNQDVHFVNMGYNICNLIGKHPSAYCGDAPFVSHVSDSRGYTERHKDIVQDSVPSAQSTDHDAMFQEFTIDLVFISIKVWNIKLHHLQKFWPWINPLMFWYGNTMGYTSWYDTGDPEGKVTENVHAGKGSVTE